MSSSPRTKIVLAFAAIYIIWGSTYLGIRVALESLPPFLMAGTRFGLAGLVLFAWSLRSGFRPTWQQWRGTALTGALLFLGGNGLVTWAQQWAPSGVAALAVATVPLWVTVLGATVFGSRRPGRLAWMGVALGLGGTVLLAAPAPGAVAAAPPGPLVVLILAAACWALGSLLTARLHLPASPVATSGMQMLMGGVWLVIAGTATGEWSRVDLTTMTAVSLWSWAYLVVFGSIVAVSAYVWLVQTVSPVAVSTYAFVNPVVAMFLGSALAGEVFGPRTMMSAFLVLSAVALILCSQLRRRAKDEAPRTRVAAGSGLRRLFRVACLATALVLGAADVSAMAPEPSVAEHWCSQEVLLVVVLPRGGAVDQDYRTISLVYRERTTREGVVHCNRSVNARWVGYVLPSVRDHGARGVDRRSVARSADVLERSSSVHRTTRVVPEAQVIAVQRPWGSTVM